MSFNSMFFFILIQLIDEKKGHSHQSHHKKKSASKHKHDAKPPDRPLPTPPVPALPAALIRGLSKPKLKPSVEIDRLAAALKSGELWNIGLLIL